MIISLSKLRHIAAITLLAASPSTSQAQLTTDQLGALHNEVLGKYFGAGNAMITSANLNTQLPIAVSFVCRELAQKGLSCKGCDNQAYGTSVMAQFIADRKASPSPSAFFDSRVSLITARFPVSGQEQSLVN